MRAKDFNSFSLGIRLSSPVDVNQEDIINIQNIDWKNIKFSEAGDDGRNIIHINTILPYEGDKLKDGIIVDIQLVNDMFYQVHINITKELRGQGLSFKIYRALIETYGHIYSGKGRRQSELIERVWNKLKSEPGVFCDHNDIANICISEKNPELENLKNNFRSI